MLLTTLAHHLTIRSNRYRLSYHLFLSLSLGERDQFFLGRFDKSDTVARDIFLQFQRVRAAKSERTVDLDYMVHDCYVG
jgi:hypothetical protein